MSVTTDPGTLVQLPYDQRATALFDYFAARRPEAVGPSQQADVWEVFGYEEATQVLNDHASFSNDFSTRIPAEEAQLRLVAQGNLAGADPPRHDLLRALVSQAFTPRVIDRLTPRITMVAEALTERMLATADGGRTDIVQALASPLSATVIAELFGIPQTDQRMFWGWSDQLLGARPDGALGAPDGEAIRRRAALVEEAGRYLIGHIRRCRAEPGDDLTSGLAHAEVDGQRLSDEEVMGVIGMFLIAGHLPTSLLIGNTVLCLDRHPDAAAALRADPESVPSAIEEVLRWMPPLVRDQRLAVRDVTVGGATIPAGAMVVVWVASANRDARRFTEPDRFDIQRRPNRHLSFGRGIHYCIGAPLARLEAAVALRVLLRRCAGLAVARDAGVEFHRSIGMLGPVRLPVDLTVT